MGLGDTLDRNAPHELVLKNVDPSNIVSVRCGPRDFPFGKPSDPLKERGPENTFISLNNYEVHVCGCNYNGELGLNPDVYGESACKPIKLSFNVNIKYISCGADHTIFHAIDETFYICGSVYRGLTYIYTIIK